MKKSDVCKVYTESSKKGFYFCNISLFFLSSLFTEPWSNRRKSSVSSPGIPPTPTANVNDQWEMRNQPNDSGIEPDASIGYHQGTVVKSAYALDETDGMPSTTSGEQSDVRSRSERSISFKDEVGAKEMLLGKQTHYPEATVGPCGASKEKLNDEVPHISQDIGDRDTSK